MSSFCFSLTPIGGVGEIGSNLTYLKTEDEHTIIDCGMLFPYEDFFDINYLIPDFSYIDGSKIKKIIITHAHEDHIGALKHFLDLFPHVVVYASPFAQEVIKRKLGQTKRVQFAELKNKYSIDFGHFSITPFWVNHSIPETYGLIIKTLDKRWGGLFISDFKVDLTSTHEPAIDLNFINKELLSCTETAFFIDSTNILVKGKTPSENDLLPDIEEILSLPNKRLFMTMFASNIHRIEHIVKLAQKHQRKIVYMGRSLATYLESAKASNIIDFSIDDLYSTEQAKQLDSKLLVLVSGCQGDFHSALRRFSFGEDSTYKPCPGDIVVFSSKVIPGNEKKISRIYNKLTEFGVDIIHAYDKHIHASGHPGQEDLRLLLKQFQPHHYFPIHGESYFLKKHQDFIQENYPQIKAHLFHNFDEIVFTSMGIKKNKLVSQEPRIIHGDGLEIERSQISQRRKLATQGCVFATLNKKNHEVEITLLGLPLLADQHLPKLSKVIIQLYQSDLHHRDAQYSKDQIRIAIRQFFNPLLGYKPLAQVHLI